MKIIFVRHGKAEPYCDFDAGRNLTEFGQKQAKQSAQHLLANYAPHLIIASPFKRAKQTAKIIQQSANDLGSHPIWVTLNSITPDDDPKIAINDIEKIITEQKVNIDTHQELCVVVVCHMPIVERMVSILDGYPPAFFELAQYKVMQIQYGTLSADFGTVIDTFVPEQP